MNRVLDAMFAVTPRRIGREARAAADAGQPLKAIDLYLKGADAWDAAALPASLAWGTIAGGLAGVVVSLVLH